MLLLLPDLISKCMYATDDDDDDDDPSQTAQNGKLFSLPAELISSNRVSRDGLTKRLLRPGIQGSIAQATDAKMVVEIRVLTEKFESTLHPLPDTDHFLLQSTSFRTIRRSFQDVSSVSYLIPNDFSTRKSCDDCVYFSDTTNVTLLLFLERRDPAKFEFIQSENPFLTFCLKTKIGFFSN